MINFYLYVSDNNDSNPSFHEEQLPAIAARRGSWWMFSHASTGSLQVKTFTQKKTTTTTATTTTTTTTATTVKTIQTYRC